MQHPILIPEENARRKTAVVRIGIITELASDLFNIGEMEELSMAERIAVAILDGKISGVKYTGEKND